MVCWLRRVRSLNTDTAVLSVLGGLLERLVRSLYTDTAVLSVLGGLLVKAGEKLVH